MITAPGTTMSAALFVRHMRSTRISLSEESLLAMSAIGLVEACGELFGVLLYCPERTWKAHVLNELGDMLWYSACLCDALGYEFAVLFEEADNKSESEACGSFYDAALLKERVARLTTESALVSGMLRRHLFYGHVCSEGFDRTCQRHLCVLFCHIKQMLAQLRCTPADAFLSNAEKFIVLRSPQGFSVVRP